jgi:predicted protein tyrosine phosphatase
MEWIMQGSSVLVLSGLVMALILGRAVLAFSRSRTPYCSAGVLLTAAELRFFRVLRQAVPPACYVACKVRLADIILVGEGLSRKNQSKAFNRIKSKHADFVLCEVNSFRILGVIELDDRSHMRTDRRKRDQFFDDALTGASVPVLRVPARRDYDADELRQLLGRRFAPKAAESAAG